MSYQIKLNVFEGPYDLLLFLIRRGEVDIYDIPIARITKEYLEYIDAMRALDLEIAGEFIVMAATLMRIKAKMLLPVHVDEDEEAEDPRNELVRSLLEYQRIKDASGKIEDLEYFRRDFFIRGNTQKDFCSDIPEEEFELQMNIYELVVAYNQILKRESKSKHHFVEPEPVTIENQMDQILSILESEERISFQRHLMDIKDTIIIVINFLAILELAKRRMITIAQTQPFKDIWIYKRSQK